MNSRKFITKLMISLWLTWVMTWVHAGTPLWTFTPLTATTITVAANDTATVRYQVTNQSRKPHTLVMKAMPGVTQITTTGSCQTFFVLGYQQSCILNLSINGSALMDNILGGPIVCSQDNPNQCYQPSSANSLHITKGSVIDYTVGGFVFGLSGTLVLEDNGGDALTLNADGTFAFSNALPPGSTYLVTVRSQPANQTCTVTNGSGIIGGANVTNVGVNCVTNLANLSASVSQLALSVTGLTEYGVSGTPSSGLARIITITNTGNNAAINLSVTPPTWPTGTSNTTTCGNTLPVNSSCTITITPGATATSDGTNPCSGGTAPVPGVVQVSADNANTVTSNVVVLGYGCVYQGGYVYALDDTTPNTGSVGGKVVTTTDQAAAAPNGIVWSSNGGTGSGSGGFDSIDVSNDTLPGIDNTSTSTIGSPSYGTFTTFFSNTYTNPNPFTPVSFANCKGSSDGSCNTANIVTFYNQFITNNTSGSGGSAPFTASPGPTNLAYYAAGLCKQPIASYTDWYLPAICELGYGSLACGTSTSPTVQNIQLSLIDNSGFSAPTGTYWSSTEFSLGPQIAAWNQSFGSSGLNGQDASGKDNLLGVRCSRALTF
ncbi:hypothetical protein ACNVED_07465 [Legionella sp. D16C41]|uniref:hypothetical protein n=1 Tax=Legionella sp. D16C41 TaxID=3402688 RepID=UPI003AF779F5